MRQLPAEKGQDGRSIAVRLADCEGSRNQASILINRMYNWRGYGDDHHLGASEHRVTFTAASGENILGTLTLTVDSPAGLSTDHSFRQELDELRAQPGVKLCELTKFAVDPSTKSPAALAALFHVIFIYGIQKHDCTDLVIEVHPRHVRYYEAMLGFKRIGPAKIDNSVTWWPLDTPVQLMHLRVADIRAHIDHHTRNPVKDSRSLYPYFFSPEEEKGVAARVARLHSPHEASTTAGPGSPRQNRPFWRAAA